MSIGKDKWTGYEEVKGKITDIREYLEFELYNLVWWWDRPDKTNAADDPRILARGIGISKIVRSDM